jgi:hypothetical protein
MDPTSAPFVGRDRELETLRAAVSEARAGRGGVVLVAGEPGIGKTRTVAEALRDLPAERVLWGRCHEGEGAPAYWPWTQALRTHVQRSAPDALGAELGADAAELARVLPAIRERLPETPAPSHETGEAARFRLFDAMAGYLRRVGREAPLALVLDDLHWADRESLLLLRFVAPEIRQARVLVAGTYREVEMRQAAAVPHVIAELARVGRSVALRGLGADDVGRLVRHGSGLRTSDALVATIHRITEGNPFFVQEVAELLRGDGASPPSAERFRLPDSVREAIRRRLGPLPEKARRLLAVAAVLGREFDVPLLARTAGLAAPETLDLLARGASLGLVEDVPGRPGRHRFAHALFQETLHDDLPLVARVALHRRAGDALEALHPGDPTPVLGDLARHFFHADPESLPKAIDYAIRAGDLAYRRLGWEEAAGHYERALQAQLVVGAEPQARMPLLYDFGRAQRRTGDHDGARASFLEEATLARAAGDPIHLAMGTIGLCYTRVETRRVDHAVVSLLEEALRAIGPEDNLLRAELLAYLARALYFACGEEARREALSAEAVAVARRVDARLSLVRALNARHYVLWGPGPVEERLAVADEAIRLAEELGDTEVAADACAGRVLDLLELGRIAEVERELATLARIAQVVRYTEHGWQVVQTRAALALLAGRFEEAETLSARAASMPQNRSENNAAHFHAAHLFTIRREQGRLGELARATAALAQADGALPIWRCGLALLHAELGDAAAARRVLRELAVRRFEDLPRDGNFIPSLALLAEVTALLDDAEVAAMLYPLLAPHAERNVVAGLPAMCLGPAARHLGLLALTAGRPDDAVTHFEAAHAAATRLGARPYVAHAAHGLARALRARGAAGDAARARALLAEAGGLAAELGMTNLLRRLEADAAPAPAGAAVPAEEVATLRREGEFWTVGYAGAVLRLRDSKGVAYLAHLLRHPGREFHALDLGNDGTGAPAGAADGNLARAADSDAGEVLDAEARAAYRRRLVELRDELEEARAFNDAGRTARLEAEMQALTDALAQGMGLGGRARRAGSHAERARLNVTRAIARVLRKIEAESPALAAYLAATVRTGLFCSYVPDPRRPIAWTV